MPLKSPFLALFWLFWKYLPNKGSKYAETVKLIWCNIFFSIGYIMLRVGILSGRVPGNGGAWCTGGWTGDTAVGPARACSGLHSRKSTPRHIKESGFHGRMPIFTITILISQVNAHRIYRLQSSIACLCHLIFVFPIYWRLSRKTDAVPCVPFRASVQLHVIVGFQNECQDPRRLSESRNKHPEEG